MIQVKEVFRPQNADDENTLSRLINQEIYNIQKDGFKTIDVKYNLAYVIGKPVESALILYETENK